MSRYNIRFENHRGQIFFLKLDEDDKRKRPRYIVGREHLLLPVYQGRYKLALEHFAILLAETVADLTTIAMVRETLSQTLCSPGVSFLERLQQLRKKPYALAKFLPRAFRAAFKSPRRRRGRDIQRTPETIRANEPPLPSERLNGSPEASISQ